MSVRRIGYNESLESIRDELVYTRARLEADADARDLAPRIQDLIGRWQGVRQGQLDGWDAELVAQAQVDAVDYALDGAVEELATNLDTAVRRDRQSPRWKRYFGSDTPGAIRHLGLASETSRVSGWIDSLKSESEPELRQCGQHLAQLVTEAGRALEARQKAATVRADHRAREIMTLVDDLNALRLSLYGELITRVGKTSRDRSWPAEFFYHAPRARRATTTPAGSGQPA